MSDNTINRSWAYIIELTQSMEQSANKEDWPVVSQMSAARHQSIDEHFKRFPVGPDTATFYYQHLSHFLKKEEQLQQLANTARKKALQSSLTLVSNKKAISSYNTIRG